MEGALPFSVPMSQSTVKSLSQVLPGSQSHTVTASITILKFQSCLSFQSHRTFTNTHWCTWRISSCHEHQGMGVAISSALRRVSSFINFQSSISFSERESCDSSETLYNIIILGSFFYSEEWIGEGSGISKKNIVRWGMRGQERRNRDDKSCSH